MADSIVPQPEINKAANILAGLYEFQGTPQERASFIVNADLRSFVSGLVLTGPSAVVAALMLNRLNTHGYLLERPAYHALGVLFAYMLGRQDVEKDDKTFIAGLIVQYGLVLDPAYLDSLRTFFKLSVAPPPNLGAAYKAPPAPSGAFPTPPTVQSTLDDAAKVNLERVLNSDENFLDLYVLQGALYCARAVARIELPEGTPLGTGFLIAPDLLLTNQHVLKDPSYLEGAVARFGYISDMLNVPQAGQTFKLAPGFFYSSPENELDYALVQLESEPLQALRYAGKPGEKSMLELIGENKHLGYLLLSKLPIMDATRVNIIQHPKGSPLKVVLTQNHVTGTISDKRVHYVADTDDGSSGSPVLNQRWEVVALHHGSLEITLNAAGGGKRISYENEGIPMRSIIDDFKSKKILGFVPQFR